MKEKKMEGEQGAQNVREIFDKILSSLFESNEIIEEICDDPLICD